MKSTANRKRRRQKRYNDIVKAFMDHSQWRLAEERGKWVALLEAVEEIVEGFEGDELTEDDKEYLDTLDIVESVCVEAIDEIWDDIDFDLDCWTISHNQKINLN